MTKTHTGTTDWTEIVLTGSGPSDEGGVEMVCLAANTGLAYYADGTTAPSDLTTSYPIRLDNPVGVFLPASHFRGGNSGNKLWVKLTVSGDSLGIRSY